MENKPTVKVFHWNECVLELMEYIFETVEEAMSFGRDHVKLHVCEAKVYNKFGELAEHFRHQHHKENTYA